MFRNYVKIAFRTLRRNVTYSIINIAGLAVGIASSILILLWVVDEVTFDSFFPKYNTIHKVMVNHRLESGIVTRDQVPLPLTEVLLAKSSQIKRSAPVIGQDALLSVNENKLTKAGLDVGPDFLKIFEFKFLYGDPNTALGDMRSIVLTESTANALFGPGDPVGKTIRVKIENNDELKVTGVIADPPTNTSFEFKFLLPFSYFEATSVWINHAKNNWNNNAFQLYVELQDGADKQSVDEAISGMLIKNNPNGPERKLFLHPMSRWRLHGKFKNGVEANGNSQYVRLFSIIAVFILVIACINFMNLSTARAERRAKEVGIRKSSGSRRFDLILQFFGESFIVSILAFLLAVIFVQLAMPLFNDLVGKQLSIDFLSYQFWIFGIGIILVTGLLSGSYPALYLSGFRPVQVLKGGLALGKQAGTPRKITVTLQFCFSIILMIGTAVIYEQIQFLRERELGYDREKLLMIWSTSDIEKNFDAIKAELINGNGATSVCKSNTPITYIAASSPVDGWPGMRPDQRVEVTNIATEYDYTKTMGIKVLEGRDFSRDFRSDTAAILLNRTAVSTMDLKNPVGEKIQMWGSSWTIIGVVDDVLMGSASRNITPTVITMDPTWSSTINVRLDKAGDVATSLASVAKVFKKYNPDYTFDYRFADVEFEKKFAGLKMISGMARAFSALAIFITALGLFGMAAYTAEQRTKEIGIRKVLGASVTGLVLLLSKDFSRMVILAFAVSAPIAGWSVHQFLQQYEIKTPLPLWVFPVAGIVALVFTVVIVSTQAIRAAVANPVTSLRNE